ncbi:MAG TPA: ABC transporter substrate-binding protein, partial [Candidatus Saccharimonadales bacterium]|nr:ABC transporter substrate-binding protein [Candidatus Saccharimonadales bacterium]
MKKIAIILVVIVLSIFGVMYIKHIVSPKPLVPITVRLGWLGSEQFAGMYVAKEKGYYKEAGLQVDLQEYKNGTNNIDQVVNGSVDFSITAPIEIITAINSGKRIKAVSSIYQISPLSFMSLETANITSPVSLKGKILGVKGGTPQTKLKYLALLQTAHLTEKDVTFKNLDYNETEAQDLLNKKADIVDVYRTNQPFELLQKNIPYNLLLPEDYGIKGYGDTIITTQQMINQKPEIIRSFVQATSKGWEYAITHPDEALQIGAKYQNKLYNDPKLEAYILQQATPLVSVTAGRPIGSMDFVVWNDVAGEMKQENLLPNNFDVTSA